MSAIPPTPEESPVIKLPDDPALVEKLREKLKDYQRRLNRNIMESFQPPENQSKWYAVRILTAVLEQKEVNSWELCREIYAQLGGYIHMGYFTTYCGVIDEYCKGEREIEIKS